MTFQCLYTYNKQNKINFNADNINVKTGIKCIISVRQQYKVIKIQHNHLRLLVILNKEPKTNDRSLSFKIGNDVITFNFYIYYVLSEFSHFVSTLCKRYSKLNILLIKSVQQYILK